MYTNILKIKSFVLFGILVSIISFNACSKQNETNLTANRDHILTDKMDNAENYYKMHPAFEEAFNFLRMSTLAELPAGRNEIDGDRLFCIVSKDTSRSRAEAKLEVHRRYIDIQYIISGTDEMGWRPTSTCKVIDTEYDANNDIGFFKDEPETWTKVPAGSFAIFFPADAHAPMVGDEDIHKVVLKVLIEQ